MPFSFRALFRDVVSRRAPPPHFIPASFILTLPAVPLHNVQNMDEHAWTWIYSFPSYHPPSSPSQCVQQGWTYSSIPRATPNSGLTSDYEMQMTRRGAKVVECGIFLRCWLHCGTTCRPHVHYAVSYGMCDAVKQGLDAPKRVCVFQPAVPSYVNNFISEG